jgi:hypothetical protein
MSLTAAAAARWLGKLLIGAFVAHELGCLCGASRLRCSLQPADYGNTAGANSVSSWPLSSVAHTDNCQHLTESGPRCCTGASEPGVYNVHILCVLEKLPGEFLVTVTTRMSQTL